MRIFKNISLFYNLTEMSQKSITSFFTKSPAIKPLKRSFSEVENIDSSNLLTDKRANVGSAEELKTSESKLLESSSNEETGCNLKTKENESETVTELIKMSQIEINKLTAQIKLLSKMLPALHHNIGVTWFEALRSEFDRPYFKKLSKFLTEERSKTTPIFPRHDQVWTWTRECRIDEIKVVILGQDPYHHPGQAHGLCFSVPVGIPPPPSLLNMYKELENDIEGFKRPGHGYLIGWARQGVLLLNAVLTVKARTPNSHKDQGWEKLTDAVIKHLNSQGNGIVFLLWGAYAQKKAEFVDERRHHVLKTVHPSPLSASRGFFGCKHFSMCNELLKRGDKTPIDWSHLPAE